MTETSSRRNLLICLCLLAAIALVYSPVRHFGFINYDDEDYVTANAHVQNGLTLQGLVWAFTTNHASNWHPLTWLSHMLDWQLWKGNAGADHVVNVILHAANTLLLFGLLRRMTGSSWRSGFVAGLFALHPLHVESVAWVSERKDVLSTCFWMLTIGAYVRYVDQPNRWRYLATLGLYALGLMAKPMVVTLPFVLLLLDYWPLGRTQWAKPATGERIQAPPSQLLKEKLPFLVLTAMSCAVTYWAQQSGEAVMALTSLPLGRRIGNALLSYVGYMGRTFWPTGLAAYYPLPTTLSVTSVIAAGAGLVGITATVIRQARRRPWFATGWFWYLGTLVPVIGLVQVGAQSMADRYTYIPLIGLFLMLAWSLPEHAMKHQIGKVVPCIVAAAALAVCAVMSGIQVRYWKDSETLFRHALSVTRDNWLAQFNLAQALEKAGKQEEAIEHYQEVLRIKPRDVTARYNLAGTLARLGRVPEAIVQWEEVLLIKPDYAEVHYNLGFASARAGNLGEAITHFSKGPANQARLRGGAL